LFCAVGRGLSLYGGARSGFDVSMIRKSGNRFSEKIMLK
jgi:hypothetical protein